MGLKPKHLRELDGIGLKPLEDKRRRFAELRGAYKDDSVALQQIDVYDRESPYHRHFGAYRDARTTGDTETRTREETWIREHYPAIN